MLSPSPLAHLAVAILLLSFLFVSHSAQQTAKIDGGDLPRSRLFSAVPPTEDYDVCIVGAGLSGAVLAERYATLLRRKVLVMDARPHIGGNCYDYIDHSTGIRVNKYGAHLFHTDLKHVWKYITNPQWPQWVPWEHQVKAWVQDKLVPIPVNIHTVNQLFSLYLRSSAEMDEWLRSVQVPCGVQSAGGIFRKSRSSAGDHHGIVHEPDSTALGEKKNSSRPQDDTGQCQNAEEMAKSRVGQQLYDMVFKSYTRKQWGVEAESLDASVTARIPVRNDFDGRYFADRYQALPSQGYTAWFAAVLNHTLIHVALNVDFFRVKAMLEGRCGKVVYTGPIDQYFSSSNLERLQYRSIRFEKEIVKNIGKGTWQTESVVNYPEAEVPYTRVVEYKHFLWQQSNHTILLREYSTDVGEPYYPVPNQRNRDLYERYRALAKKEEAEKGVVFVGRLANYKYFNMDDAIANALRVFAETEHISLVRRRQFKIRLP